MKRFLAFVLLLFNSSFLFAHIEQLFFLEGTLGNKPIAMRIHREEDLYHGEYFFLSDKKNISFRGECNSKDCLLSVFVMNQETHKEESTEVFRISENNDHTWSGTWRKGSNTVNILLKPIDVSKFNHPYKDLPFIKSLDPYSYVRTSELKFSAVRTKKINGITVEWLKETISGVEFIRLGKGLPTEVLNKVNTTLTGLHLAKSEGSFWCNPSTTNLKDYKFIFNISLLNKSILSLTALTTSNCFATTPETTTENITLDIKTGQQLSLEDIFYAGNKTIPAVNSAEWFDYRYKTFGAIIHKLLLNEYPDKMKASTGACSYNKDEAWQFPDWKLGEKGLLVKAFLPDYLHCEKSEEFLIPYTKLEEYRKREIR